MSIFSDLKPHAKNNRNVFDLTRTSTFSSKSGMIEPVFIQETVPDGKYKIDVSGIIRTLPMQNANFTTLKSNIEFFFVPYSQLWHYFNQFYYGRGDQHRSPSSSIALDAQPAIVPTFDYEYVAKELVKRSLHQLFLQELMKYLDYLLTIDPKDIEVVDYVSTLSYPDKNVIFTKYYQDCAKCLNDFLDDYNQSSSSVAYLSYHFFDVHGRMCYLDMVRMFDLLGFGNLLPFIKTYWNGLYEYFWGNFGDKPTFKLVYDETDSEWQLQIKETGLYYPFVPYSQQTTGESWDIGTGDPNTTGWKLALQSRFNWISNVYVVAEQQNLNINGFIPKVSPNPFRIMAFFKIWNDYYRNAQYDNLPYHHLFNADYLTNPQGNNTMNVERILRMLVPNYHQYKRDRFTGSYPDSQFGDVAVAGLNNPTKIFSVNDVPFSSNQVVYSAGSGLEPQGIERNSLVTVASGQVVSDKFRIDSSVSVLAIRQAEALQRWKEKILRAGNREKDLQDAIFGVKSKYIEDGYVDFLGSCDGLLNVNPVASTASTTGAELGELGAFSVGSISMKEIDYEAKDFGVIIGVQYVMPETKYDAFGLDAFNTKVLPDDFYKPDFQNLGLAPVYNSDFNIFNYLGFENGQVKRDNAINVLGYLSRYYEYKTQINKVHGEFYGLNPLLMSAYSEGVYDYGVEVPPTSIYTRNAFLTTLRGNDSNLVSVRDIRNFDVMKLSSLYCSPADVDTLFYQESDITQLSDQFRFECTFGVKAILPMSVDGLPY